MMVKISIVGCGKIGDRHIEGIQKLGCACVLAVCDLEPIPSGADRTSLLRSAPDGMRLK
jgi:predicted dehydrogenase